MIELFDQELRKNDRQSSKGNQLKWENNGIWYKADYTGYEGLSEYLISHLLEYSTLSSEEFVIYEQEQMSYHTVIYSGVKSIHFLKEDWQIITLERLFRSFFGESLTRLVWNITDVKERFRFLVLQVERITGLKDFGIYLNKLFTIDALFLNEDRHMHNIAVLMNSKGEFAYCPIFDNGGSLLSDTTMDYPLDMDVYLLMDEVNAKTISRDFDEQLDASEHVCGENIKFAFTKKTVYNLMQKTVGYSDEIIHRVEDIIFYQMRRYRYLFR